MAEDMARAALSVAPTNGSFLDTLGYVLLRRGRSAEAINLLEKAHARAPKDLEIACHLGMVYAEYGAPKSAERLLTEALQNPREFRERAACRQWLQKIRASMKGGA
ncbi:MAG: hypothetical protein COY42_30825 [Armatimonadetes bacterium CG_4_10_14_0_8_um_filter_66_14]|nr:MAG: hypothetical protein COY42_30825 [Armatimonadetes bacterium CG_4_10_14_0_8_um_filter_66_14]